MKKLTYEAGVEELTQLIARIEDGQPTLEETIKAYEKGAALADKLSALLQEGKGRILKLQESGEQVPFEGEEEAE